MKETNIMDKKRILDHGYVELVETWGSDERIIEAARMSTGKGFNGWGELRCSCGAIDRRGDGQFKGSRRCPTERGGGHVALSDTKAGDEKLLAFLYDNKHATPFEMAGMIVEVKAPIFVFREWHRHRTQSYNEMSARYTPLPNENYTPTLERLMVGSDGKNKQAGTIAAADALTHENALAWLEELESVYAHAERVYQSGLQRGIPKELARLPVPVARYSRMRASANLRNWLAFLTLRSDKNTGAQWEIRQFANAVGALIKKAHPRTWELFA